MMQSNLWTIWISNPLGGGIKQLHGYEVSIDNTPGVRPTDPKFIAGFFVNDYAYTGTGDLDESNGRYCKTPEYPDGVYAYFVSQTTDQSGRSQPTFPYLIGPYFHSQPIEENFLPSINQDVDFTDHGLTRMYLSITLPQIILSTDQLIKLMKSSNKNLEFLKLEHLVLKTLQSSLQGITIKLVIHL